MEKKGQARQKLGETLEWLGFKSLDRPPPTEEARFDEDLALRLTQFLI